MEVLKLTSDAVFDVFKEFIFQKEWKEISFDKSWNMRYKLPVKDKKISKALANRQKDEYAKFKKRTGMNCPSIGSTELYNRGTHLGSLSASY